MAAPSVVQSATAAVGPSPTTGSTLSVSLTGVTAGNLLVLLLHEGKQQATTFTINDAINGDNKDNQNNAWTRLLTKQAGATRGHTSAIAYAPATAGGNTTVRVNAVSATSFAIALVEVNITGSGASVVDQTSFNDYTSIDITNHYAAADANVIDTAADVIVFVVGSHGYSITVNTGSGYTRINSGPSSELNAWGIFQYKISAGALTNEQGAWTTASAENHNGVMASFVAGSAPSTFVPSVVMIN